MRGRPNGPVAHTNWCNVPIGAQLWGGAWAVDQAHPQEQGGGGVPHSSCPRGWVCLSIAALLLSSWHWLEMGRRTQAGAAKARGVTQARVSDLKRGKMDRFSMDLLVRLAA